MIHKIEMKCCRSWWKQLELCSLPPPPPVLITFHIEDYLNGLSAPTQSRHWPTAHSNTCLLIRSSIVQQQTDQLSSCGHSAVRKGTKHDSNGRILVFLWCMLGCRGLSTGADNRRERSEFKRYVRVEISVNQSAVSSYPASQETCCAKCALIVWQTGEDAAIHRGIQWYFSKRFLDLIHNPKHCYS